MKADSVGLSLVECSHKTVEADLIVLGSTQLQGIKRCSALHVVPSHHFSLGIVSRNSPKKASIIYAVLV